MRGWSFVQNWVRGLGVFVTMTASFVLAMSIAITGPPTEEELAGISAVLDDLSGKANVAAEETAADLCAALPPEFCGEPQVTGAPAQEPARSEIIVPPAPPQIPAHEETVLAEAPSAPSQDDALLGGGAEGAAPAVRARVERVPSERPRASRRAEQTAPARRARVARAPQAATPNPVEVERHAEVERLNEAIASVLAEPPARQEIVLPPEQAEQEMQSDDAYWDEEREDEWSEEEYPDEYWSPY